jgi:DNA-binding FadR family transcriptional regulator
MAGCAGPAEGGRMMSPGEYRAAVDAIIRRRGEEGDQAAAALAHAVADRMEKRAKDLDAQLVEWRKQNGVR